MDVGAGLVPARTVRQDNYQYFGIRSMLKVKVNYFALTRGGQGQALPLQFADRWL
jgi:hypothetical protein